MKNLEIKPGALDIDSGIKIPVVDIPFYGSKVPIFSATKGNLESGVVAALQLHAVVKDVSGSHKFWFYKYPPRRHHPDPEKHQILWLDEFGNGSEIIPWRDNSWNILAKDNDFLGSADNMFARQQEENQNLRVFHAFGFAMEDEKALINGRNIDARSIQSQFRGHVHLVESVDPEEFDTNWLAKSEILDKKGLLPYFLNIPGELAIEEYSTELHSFGEKMVYSQTVGKETAYDIKRTMFAFDSWEEALNSVIELQNTLRSGWLATAALIGESKMEFAGEHIKFMQSCIPGFTLIRPSKKDKIAGGIDLSVNWLVVPFPVQLAPAMLQPGTLFDRKNS